MKKLQLTRRNQACLNNLIRQAIQDHHDGSYLADDDELREYTLETLRNLSEEINR